MSDLLKKGFFIGIGAAVNGKEKASKMLDELIEKGQISPGEARDMLNSFKEKGEEQNKQWNSKSQDYFRDTIKELGFVTKEEYEQLELRVKKLEELHKDEE
ncbi:hypothetical protein GLW08_14515 [Pontibacillus yanchengensis]|uniref:Uncharacterized protein n=2 Tax=Pontibacillus yanchengensis TaxID=462910 RepID=A0ACC7VHX8_9BACI|nr:hypothetical protein [Pontibacillus yanchengensis]MYL34677.1 hypothetical protein [Pontibacillus yanchengensis]MYL54546.1 hypothetical protein [Pontibacillus yanchengensis]